MDLQVKCPAKYDGTHMCFHVLPIPWETEAGKSRIQKQPGLNGKSLSKKIKQEKSQNKYFIFLYLFQHVSDFLSYTCLPTSIYPVKF